MTAKPEEFGLPYLDDHHWDPFLATCEELRVPVSFHIGAGGDTFQRSVWPSLSSQRKLAVGSVALFIDNVRVIINLIFSGLLERFPTLNFVSVESGIRPDNVMFETDFPHPTCLYPKSPEHIVEVLTDLDPTVRRKVLRENAVRVYALPGA